MDSLAAETPTDIQIPDEAIDALGRTIYPDEPLTDPESREQARQVLAAVAPYLMAAELRRLAEKNTSAAGSRFRYLGPADLRARADQLDGGIR